VRLKEVINKDPEEDIIELMSAARYEIWMSSRLNPDFYNREKVREAIENAAKRVNKFRLLIDSRADWQERKSQLPWIAELVENGYITVRKSKNPILHWIIIDRKHFRLEKEHVSDIGTSNLIIWDCDKPIADILQAKFAKLWMESVDI
jgi:predicted Ser/Thr protein kinase